MPVVRAYKRLSKPRARGNETKAQAQLRLKGEDHYQTVACKNLARMHGHGLKIEWYQDVVTSLESFRPGREQMLSDCNPKDIIVGHSLFRLHRDTREALDFWDWARARKVTFYVHEGAITNEEDNPVSELIYTILSAVGKFERNIFRERMKDVQQAALDAGKKLGRPRKVTQEGADKAREFMAKGNSIRAAAKVLKVPPSTLSESLIKYYPVNIVHTNGVHHETNDEFVPLQPPVEEEDDFAF